MERRKVNWRQFLGQRTQGRISISQIHQFESKQPWLYHCPKYPNTIAVVLTEAAVVGHIRGM